MQGKVLDLGGKKQASKLASKGLTPLQGLCCYVNSALSLSAWRLVQKDERSLLQTTVPRHLL